MGRPEPAKSVFSAIQSTRIEFPAQIFSNETAARRETQTMPDRFSFETARRIIKPRIA
jgi:hypothetical protein